MRGKWLGREGRKVSWKRSLLTHHLQLETILPFGVYPGEVPQNPHKRCYMACMADPGSAIYLHYLVDETRLEGRLGVSQFGC